MWRKGLGAFCKLTVSHTKLKSLAIEQFHG